MNDEVTYVCVFTGKVKTAPRSHVKLGPRIPYVNGPTTGNPVRVTFQEEGDAVGSQPTP